MTKVSNGGSHLTAGAASGVVWFAIATLLDSAWLFSHRRWPLVAAPWAAILTRLFYLSSLSPPFPPHTSGPLPVPSFAPPLTMLRRRMPPVLILMLLLVLTGCQYDPHAHLYTTEKPETKNVVGLYVLTSQSVAPGGLTVLRGKTCSIELRADGTFNATNVPPWQDSFPSSNFFDSLISGSGTWRIDSVGSVDDGRKPLKTHWGIYLDSPGVKFDAAGLTRPKPPYGLIYTVGDPDSGEALFLERKR
jgi:hypothetical protein